jgi:hypothetical protein
MHPPSSSISSSERGEPGRRPARGEIREVLAVGGWAAASLVAIDLAINLMFPSPRDPRVASVGMLRTYFHYGRSIEGKIRHIVGPTDQTSSPVVMSGWLADVPARRDEEPPRGAGDVLVSFYGMSFTHQLGQATAELDPRVRLRLFGGPAAPPSHSYATYRLDRGGRSDVVVLGILASSVIGMATTSGMTWNFEGPTPYTYPRYFMAAAGLEPHWPLVESLAGMRERLGDRAKWDGYVARIRAEDEFYDAFSFTANPLDQSALVRLIRRAWAQRQHRAVAGRIHTDAGFNEDRQEVRCLRAIVASFAETARRDGKLPLVLLLEGRGYAGHLDRVLRATIDEHAIPCVDTGAICPATDGRNFLPDGHFTPEANGKIARAILARLASEKVLTPAAR